jgi:hypothetical protein
VKAAAAIEAPSAVVEEEEEGGTGAYGFGEVEPLEGCDAGCCHYFRESVVLSISMKRVYGKDKGREMYW